VTDLEPDLQTVSRATARPNRAPGQEREIVDAVHAWVARLDGESISPTDGVWDRYLSTLFGQGTAHSSLSLTPKALEVVFDELKQEWLHETRGESFPHRKAMHFAYQEIIGLGPDAVPLILRSLEGAANDWFWALIAITRVDVAEGVADTRLAADRWLEWGKTRGLLSGSG
jgi:hypothetical protein